MVNLMYIFGMIGILKGNIVIYVNILCMVKEMNYFSIMEQDMIFGFFNYVFDVFMFDMFGFLLNGVKFVLILKEIVLDMVCLFCVIEWENISIFMIIIVLFYLFVDLNLVCLLMLCKIMFGGEWVLVEYVRKVL